MIFFSLSLLFMYLFSYLTTVEFSKNLDEFLKVPVNFIFLSHWFLTWQSWEGNFSRTPMHLLSRLSAWLFLWWSSVNSLSLVVNSVKSSLIITRLIIIVSNWVNYNGSSISGMTSIQISPLLIDITIIEKSLWMIDTK